MRILSIVALGGCVSTSYSASVDETMDDKEGDGWEAAQKALEQARRLTGAGRIEALRRAGQLRFDADKRRQKKEEDDRQRDPMSQKRNRKSKLCPSVD